jgi:hypothetical protein
MTRLFVVMFLLACVAGNALAAPTRTTKRAPARPSLALLPLEGIAPDKELRSVEEELRKALPAQTYTLQKRDRTRATLGDMRTLGIACDTGTVPCLVQFGGLAGVNVVLRGGLSSLDDANDQLELLGVDVNGLKERGRVKVKVPRADLAARAQAVKSALIGVLQPEAWRGLLRVDVPADRRGASIHVDGLMRGFAPLSTSIELTPGPHAVFVGLEGYRAFKQTVDVVYDAEVVVDVVLEPGVSEPAPRFALSTPPAPLGASSTETTEPPPRKGAPLRVVLYDVEVVGVDARLGRVLGQLLAEEIRKRERVSVLDSSELRALIRDNTSVDTGECSAAACFAEVAEALGAEVVVVSQLTQTGGEILFGLRRIDTVKQEVVASSLERVPIDDPGALAPLVGTSVASAFADLPLRRGQKAGLDDRAVRRLAPPPLPPIWATSLYVGAAVSTAVGVGLLGVAGALYATAAATFADVKAGRPSSASDDPNTVIQTNTSNANTSAIAGSATLVLGAAAVTAALVVHRFTNWDDEVAAPEPL